MECQSKTAAASSRVAKDILIVRYFSPNQQAMLQALRVVLDMPLKAITLSEENDNPVILNDSTNCDRPTLAILPGKSDVCTLTVQNPEFGGQEGHSDN